MEGKLFKTKEIQLHLGALTSMVPCFKKKGGGYVQKRMNSFTSCA